MKVFVFFLILLSVLAIYLVFKQRPKLIAVSSFEGKINLWGNVDVKKGEQVEEAYQLTKHLIPLTLEKRLKKRGGNFSQNSNITIYFVEDKEWLYIFADNYPFKAPGVEVIGNRSLNNSVHFHLATKKFEFHND